MYTHWEIASLSQKKARCSFRQWVSKSGQSRTKVSFQRCWESLSVPLFKVRSSIPLAKKAQMACMLSIHSHSQERHLVDSRDPCCQVMTRLYSLAAQNSLDSFHSCQVEIFYSGQSIMLLAPEKCPKCILRLRSGHSEWKTWAKDSSASDLLRLWLPREPVNGLQNREGEELRKEALSDEIPGSARFQKKL